MPLEKDTFCSRFKVKTELAVVLSVKLQLL
jgi:hypothetical protein